MSRAGIGKKGSAIKLPEVGHLGTSRKHAVKHGLEFVAAQEKPELKPAGAFGRRVVRKMQGDARVTANQPRLVAKAAKKTQAKVLKSFRFARWIVAMLIRSTGAHASSTNPPKVKGSRGACFDRIDTVGTSIYTTKFPKMNKEQSHAAICG